MEGPITGILGFSQGAAMAPLLYKSLPQTLQTHIKFLICISGFVPIFEGLWSSDVEDKLSGIKSLHVIGESDSWIPPARSKELVGRWKRSEEEAVIALHPGGHFVPTGKEMRERFREFVKEFISNGDSMEVDTSKAVL
jgi:predicted esterase